MLGFSCVFISSNHSDSYFSALCLHSSWSQYQRRLYQEGKLADDRADLLTDIGFDLLFPMDRRKDPVKDSPEAWEERFQDLLAYKEENGDCAVPAIYPANPALAKWCASQRTKHKKGSLKGSRLGKIKFLSTCPS